MPLIAIAFTGIGAKAAAPSLPRRRPSPEQLSEHAFAGNRLVVSMHFTLAYSPANSSSHLAGGELPYAAEGICVKIKIFIGSPV